MRKVRGEFDYVIVDAPPLGLVIDAFIIGQHTDGTVIVIEQGVIKRKIIQEVVRQLKKGNIRILEAVLHKVDNRVVHMVIIITDMNIMGKKRIRKQNLIE